MKIILIAAIGILMFSASAHGQTPNPNKEGSLYKNGKWTHSDTAKYTFELYKSKGPSIVFQAKTVSARITYDSSLWKLDASMASKGTVSFQLAGQRNTFVSVKMRPGYLKKADIRDWLAKRYTQVYGKTENKYVNLDKVNGKEFHSYLFVSEHKGTHIVTYDMVYTDVQNSLVITTLCFGVDHMKYLPILMQFVAGIEAYDSI